MNIQHVESLNDIVYQITGVRVRETVPDRIMHMADELEVVDLPPEELLARLSEGKVYIPPQAKEAANRFFRKGNLLGLREMALRYTANKVDDDMRSYMERHGILGPWPAGSRILVCISTSNHSERLIRIGQRMAADLDAEWHAVYVESPNEWPSDRAALDRLADSMRLAENLGAKVLTLSGQSISKELLSFARSQNITLMVVGLPRKSKWKRWPMTSVVNELIKQSGPIHVLVIGNTEDSSTEDKEPERAAQTAEGSKERWVYCGSLASVAVATAFCWTFHEWLGLINVAMILLLPVVYSGITWGRRSGLVASMAAVCVLDFFFVPPRFTMAVEDLHYLPMFLVFVIVGVATSILADLVRWQGEAARQRERFVSSLYAFSRDLMAARSQEEILQFSAVEINGAFQCDVLILLPGTDSQLEEKARIGEHVVFDERKLGVATWVYQHGQPAGHGTQTLSSATFLYLPLKSKDLTLGVLGVGLGKAGKFLLPEQRRLLEAFANILALAISRSEWHS